MTDTIKEGDLDPQTRARAKKALHEANAKKREIEIQQQKADFAQAAENPVVQAMIAKARSLSDLHLQMAKDGVGMRQTGQRDEHGQPVTENIFFTKDKRMTELDKSAGLDEWINWAERMLGIQAAPVFVGAPKPTGDATVDDANEAEEIKENGPAESTSEEGAA